MNLSLQTNPTWINTGGIEAGCGDSWNTSVFARFGLPGWWSAPRVLCGQYGGPWPCTDPARCDPDKIGHQWPLNATEGKQCTPARGTPGFPNYTATSVCHKCMCTGWEQRLEQELAPMREWFDNGTYIGVFLGDEILVNGAGYLSNLTDVINKIRALIGGGGGKPPYIYWNEGVIGPWQFAYDPSYITRWDKLPQHVDFLSNDYYWDNGTTEFEQSWAFHEKEVFPKLWPHQQVLWNPGIFASSPDWCQTHNMSLHWQSGAGRCPWEPGCAGHEAICSVDAQAAQVVKKVCASQSLYAIDFQFVCRIPVLPDDQALFLCSWSFSSRRRRWTRASVASFHGIFRRPERSSLPPKNPRMTCTAGRPEIT